MIATYHSMVIESNEISAKYNFAAAAACWIMLAGFFILPGTFTTLRKSTVFSSSNDGQYIQSAVQNIPLLPLASVCYLSGISIIIFSWYCFQSKYIWIIRYLLMPTMLNCLSGLLTILINVYTAQNGFWSPTAWATLAVVLFTTLLVSSGILVYQWRLRALRTGQ
ncbi:hypothetical protein M406DRAFT_251017 [Cryphonectria parasitica EP155]|uniref:Uncharacterized protein n=1 Tax=Cryphonectria parasitica (strain ATCC 38755 / EP155) TaxID=660469 RepID=A0A9P5CSP9_CRYP1|nr:uncharacterized protein M406DRAFT_251017 [Cryphonectria parasitica EP155]KAF3768350.1 hypothetical protein M406DRAFT_251017 [Cryphonectria parasitica EP155]